MNLKAAITNILGLINNDIIPVLAVLALVVFLYGGLRFVYESKDGKVGNYKDLLLWGLVALFVLFSIWGILNLACEGLLGGTCRSTPPINTVPGTITNPLNYHGI